MQAWAMWVVFGAVLVLLEIILPGGIVIFLGISSLIVGAGVYLGIIKTIVGALLTWFIVSIVSILFLRQLFIKYFEGDSEVQNVDEDADLIGSIVEVVDEVKPYKEGRVKFRDSFWPARSNEELKVGAKALIESRDGNKLIIKSI